MARLVMSKLAIIDDNSYHRIIVFSIKFQTLMEIGSGTVCQEYDIYLEMRPT